ncbi:penicillin-binding protein 2 [bacterium]|nr:penicillin-binding protein 2 [bacterium]
MGTKFGPAADIDWPTMRLYLLIILLAFALLVGRLFWLQIMHSESFRLASLNNLIRDIEIPGPRGDIYDRAGRPLAKSVNVYGLAYIPPRDIDSYLPSADQRRALDEESRECSYLHEKTGQSLREVMRLSAYLDMTYPELMRRVETERRRLFGYQPLLLIEELSQEQVIYLEEHRDDFPGIMIEQYSFKRSYPLEGAGAHLVGYVGQLSDSDPQSILDLGYGPREKVGKEGIERSYERMLHGVPGRRDIILRVESKDQDGDNRVIEGVADEIAPQKGTDIYLTVNQQLQAKAQALLADRPGAIIVSCLQPGHEGEMLALASGPTYDPNRFDETGYYTSLIFNADGSDNATRPLLNRACRNAFPPGSTFKLVTATAALSEGVVTAGTGFYCQGYLEIGKYKRRFHCHKRTGHGSLTFLEGISESCDVVFYNLGQRLSRQGDASQTIKNYAELFGFGAPVGIALPGEVSGLVPDRDWKREHYAGERYNEIDRSWYDGDTLNYMIGQGYLTATPLQVLWSANVIAWDGWWYPPRLLKSKRVATQIVPVDTEGTPLKPDENGQLAYPLAEQPLPRGLDGAALATVRSGMRLAVTDGTCKRVNVEGLAVCAKTGTAETGIAGEDSHAWIVGFYPQSAPEYSFVVFFQNGGSAGETAVPAARELLKYMQKFPPVGAENGES